MHLKPIIWKSLKIKSCQHQTGFPCGCAGAKLSRSPLYTQLQKHPEQSQRKRAAGLHVRRDEALPTQTRWAPRSLDSSPDSDKQRNTERANSVCGSGRTSRPLTPPAATPTLQILLEGGFE